MYCFNEEEYQKRMEWYVNARFGMFLHWGLYAIPARGEWMRSFEKLTDEEYQRYFDEFNPTDYDPKKWAHMAKQAGMKYMVLRQSIMMDFVCLTASIRTLNLQIPDVEEIWFANMSMLSGERD